MDKRETRRINPIARITLVLVASVVLLEAFVILGGLELHAESVQKYAPWIHEAFLKIVGEHPDFKPRWLADEEPTPENPSVSALAGLAPEAIPNLMETNVVDAAETNQLIEPTIPPEPETVPAPTNAPPDGEIVPVG